MADCKPQAPTIDGEYGITRLEAGATKEAGTPSPELPKLIRHIELLGARVAWSRAAFCPCEGINNQTDQPNPRCPKCQGRGFFYFGPPNYKVPEEAGDLTSVQKAILTDHNAAVIRTLFTRSSTITDPYDVLGTWVRGSMFATVRPENKIGYFDRLVNLDAEVCYSETVEVDLTADPNFDQPLPLRYRAVRVNTLETVADRYLQDRHFQLTEDGSIYWLGATPAPTNTARNVIRLTAHYTMHPAWLIVEYPHVLREAPTRRKIKDPTTPFGTPTALPLQALARLEFLPKTERDEKF